MNFPSHLHHAYVIEGNVAASRTALFYFLKAEYGVLPGNPDLFLFSADAFGVDDSRAITEANMRKALSSSGKSSGKKFIVADFHSISGQAQNSLLKTLEEPYPGTHIFLLTSTAVTLLPTVLSRVHVIQYFDADKNAGKEITGKGGVVKGMAEEGESLFNAVKEAQKFLGSKPAERLEMIKRFLAEKEKENIGDADLEAFISALEVAAHSAMKNAGKGTGKLKPFLVADEYIRDSSSSKKLLLEYVALALPVLNN